MVKSIDQYSQSYALFTRHRKQNQSSKKITMILRRKTETQAIESPTGNHSLGANEVSIVRHRQIPDGLNPRHTHDRQEVMVMLEGSVTVSTSKNSSVLNVRSRKNPCETLALKFLEHSRQFQLADQFVGHVEGSFTFLA
jgi:hypothetical protein